MCDQSALVCECGLPLYVARWRDGCLLARISLRRVTFGLRGDCFTIRGRCPACGRFHEISEPEQLLRAELDKSAGRE